jgi:uncharacterized membrane protein YraQ (UPF0718 family)/copper chaperone CopZ
MMKFLESIYILFIEMAPYLMIGLAFVAILDIYITKKFVKEQIGGKGIGSVVKAALFGVPLPLCSCGVIPTTVYMADSKASKGAVTSFLVSTPQTGIDSIVATYGMMGPVFGFFRPIAAFIMGITTGLFINKKFPPEEEKKKFNLNVINSSEAKEIADEQLPIKERAKNSLRYAFVDFLDDIVVEFLIGLLIAAAITYFLPTEFLAGTGLQSGILGMLLMIIIGIPMYVCATASIPIALSLILKGFSPGVAFVFLAVGPATNAASIGILSKSLGKQLIIYYLTTLIVLSIIFGYLLDFVFSYLGINPQEQLAVGHHHDHDSMSLIPHEIQIALSVIFTVLVIGSLYRKYGQKWFAKKTKADDRESIEVKGMTCNHCVATVTDSLSGIANIGDVEVNLAQGKAYYTGNPDKEVLKKAIQDCGYETNS